MQLLNKNILTAPALSGKNESANNRLGAYPAFTILCEKGGFCFWAIQPADSLHREVQGWTLIGHLQICGLFYLSASKKTIRRCLMAQIWFKPLLTRQDVSDRLENLASVSAIITDILAGYQIDRDFQLSDFGVF